MRTCGLSESETSQGQNIVNRARVTQRKASVLLCFPSKGSGDNHHSDDCLDRKPFSCKGKAKQETPVVLEDENEPDMNVIIEGSSKVPINGSDSDIVPNSEIPNKSILAASAFGWTGGDDEEYQAFHRRLASEEQDEEQSEVYREIDKEEREDEIDEGLDRAPLSVVDASAVPI